MPWGMSMAPTVMPAAMSPEKSARVYFGSHSNTGNKRCHWLFAWRLIASSWGPNPIPSGQAPNRLHSPIVRIF
jgi:hypothetical protein